MSDLHDIHRLQHSLVEVAVDAVDTRLANEREAAELGAGDMIQQVQLPVEGYAGALIGTSFVDVTFLHPFFNDIAPGQMGDSNLKNPTFVPGVEITSDDPVLVHAQVRRWLRNDRSLITGAQLRVMAWSPDAAGQHQYKGVLHCSFIGFGAPNDDDEEDE